MLSGIIILKTKGSLVWSLLNAETCTFTAYVLSVTNKFTHVLEQMKDEVLIISISSTGRLLSNTAIKD